MAHQGRKSTSTPVLANPVLRHHHCDGLARQGYHLTCSFQASQWTWTNSGGGFVSSRTQLL